MTGRSRAAARVAASAAVALLVLLTSAAPASATAYRYWVYWHGTSSGGWTFSPVGGTYVPPNGAVEGWRFGVSAEAGTLKPRAAASFASICGTQAPAAGNKRVALVVDYGSSADAPPGEHPPRGVDTYCAEVPTSYNAVRVIDEYGTVRTDSGLVCGIGGYPREECGVAVQPTPTPKPTSAKPTPMPTTAKPAPVPGSPGAPTPTPGQATPGTTVPSGAASPAASAGSPSVPAPATSSAAPSSPVGGGGSDDGDGSQPDAVAVGPGGLDDSGTGSSGPPLAALLGGALVIAVGGTAAWRATRSGPKADA